VFRAIDVMIKMEASVIDVNITVDPGVFAENG
jgi:hypothetical protein